MLLAVNAGMVRCAASVAMALLCACGGSRLASGVEGYLYELDVCVPGDDRPSIVMSESAIAPPDYKVLGGAGVMVLKNGVFETHATSENDGHVFVGLPEGTYEVNVFPKNPMVASFAASVQKGRVTKGLSARMGKLSGYVGVEGGSPGRRIVLSNVPAAGGVFHGTVVFERSPGCEVRLVPDTGFVGTGHFEQKNVQIGAYAVTFTAQMQDGTVETSSSTANIREGDPLTDFT